MESEPAALRALRDNVRTLGLAGALILPASVERVVEGPPPGPPYHIVFADPPYALTDTALLAVLAAVTAHGWLTEGGLLVVERPSRGTPPRWPPGVEPVRSRRYGEGTLWYGRAGPADLDGS